MLRHLDNSLLDFFKTIYHTVSAGVISIYYAHQWVEKVLRRTNNWVKDFKCKIHCDHLFRGIMTHNSYMMDAMGLVL